MAQRQLFIATLVAAVMASVSVAAQDTPAPQNPARKHALSLVGDPKFPADYKHFDWVNPAAPKGGTVRIGTIGTFDSLNPYSAQGVAAAGLGSIYDTLMATSLDEPSTEYTHIAEWVSHPADFSSVTFGLRAEARFHDGQPITPEDVMFSVEALKTANPFYSFYFKNVVKAEKTGEREVTFTFDKGGNRELPQIMGQLPVLPKHFWEAKDANGNPRDLAKSTLEVPLGSGAYKIASVNPGRAITYERVKDYWAKDLPIAVGQWNFDQLSFQFFRDRVPAFEAFKSQQLDFWAETSAGAWATQYEFDALKKGLVNKEAIPVQRVAPMQAFILNTRRKQFQDPRVRRAFNLAFNFERANESLFYGQYVRVGSYFGNSELEATGLPQGQEFEILNEIKSEVPPEVFTTEWKNPVNTAPTDFRQHLQEALTLLADAGWTLRDETVDDPSCGVFCRAMISIGVQSMRTARVLRNAAGETLDAEFMIDSPDFQRIVLPYVEDLKSLGVNANVRLVDSSQAKRREDTFDYDVIVDNFGQSNSPGNEQRDFWGSAAADKDGSRNSIGIKNPAIDKLIDRIVFAKDRAELVAATRALDRVLRWNHFVVPQWHYPYERIASWAMFGRPEKLPSQTAGFLQIWWVDESRQQALSAARS